MGSAGYRAVVGSHDTARSLHPARRWVLRGYAALPEWARLRLVRLLTPDYTVGALAVIEHEGRLLMLRQHHREGWTLPGGLLDRGEQPGDAVRREVAEETGLSIDPGDPLTYVLDPPTQRVDVLFHIPVSEPPTVVPASEARTARWLRPEELGELDRPTMQAISAYRDVVARRPRPGSLHAT